MESSTMLADVGSVRRRVQKQVENATRSLPISLFPKRLHTLEQRLNYATDQEPRPKHRGTLMAFLHQTSLWFALCTLYLALSLSHLPFPSVLLRAKWGLATVWGVWASDWFHNLDLYVSHGDYRRSGATWERDLLRHDITSIALIKLGHFLIWSDNVNWPDDLALWRTLFLLTTVLIVAMTVLFPPVGAPFWVVKLMFLFQFTVLDWKLLAAVWGTSCWAVLLLYLVYLPGALAYGLKPVLGRFDHFGPHEVFHVFVVLGHLSSMVLDVCVMTRGQCVTGRGSTALLLACSRGHVQTAEWLARRGADLELPDHEGRTPFALACRNGHLAVVELLLEQGVDAGRCNLQGVTPFQKACKHGRWDIAQRLAELE